MPGRPTVPEQGRPERIAPHPHTGFVLGLDVGSSVIRCHVYDRAGRVRGSSAQKVTGSGRRAVVRAAKASGRARFSCRRAATCSPALGPAARGAGFAPRGRLNPRTLPGPGGQSRGVGARRLAPLAGPGTWAFAAPALPGGTAGAGTGRAAAVSIEGSFVTGFFLHFLDNIAASSSLIF